MADSNGHDTQDARKRLLWFAGIWLASVAAIAVTAYVMRALIGL